jgi:hypothetical protein
MVMLILLEYFRTLHGGELTAYEFLQYIMLFIQEYLDLFFIKIDKYDQYPLFSILQSIFWACPCVALVAQFCEYHVSIFRGIYDLLDAALFYWLIPLIDIDCSYMNEVFLVLFTVKRCGKMRFRHYVHRYEYCLRIRDIVTMK